MALGYSQIGSGGGEVRRYDLALPALEAGLAYCVDHELTAQAAYTRAWLGSLPLGPGALAHSQRHVCRTAWQPALFGHSREWWPSPCSEDCAHGEVTLASGRRSTRASTLLAKTVTFSGCGRALSRGPRRRGLQAISIRRCR